MLYHKLIGSPIKPEDSSLSLFKKKSVFSVMHGENCEYKFKYKLTEAKD